MQMQYNPITRSFDMTLDRALIDGSVTDLHKHSKLFKPGGDLAVTVDADGNVTMSGTGTPTLTLESTDASDPTLIFKTTNTPNQINIRLDEDQTFDHLRFTGATAGTDTQVDVQAPTGQVARFRLLGNAGASANIFSFAQAAGGLTTFKNQSLNDDIAFQLNVGGANTTVLRLDGGTGFVGFGGEILPETLIEQTHAEPFQTRHNSTHTNDADARKSKNIAKGEKLDGTEHTLGYDEWSHEGAADDQKAQKRSYVNQGSDGDAPTLTHTQKSDLSHEFVKSKLTAIGGLAILLTNETGFNTIAGQLVRADTGTDDAVILTGIGDTECIGVFLDSGIADAAEAWVVVAGIADVAFDDNVTAVRGGWVATGAAVGYARTQASPAAAPQHFEEIGHCIESVTATGEGTHILARCVLHFL